MGNRSQLELPQVLGVAQQLGGGVRVLNMPDGGKQVAVSLLRLVNQATVKHFRRNAGVNLDRR